MRIVLVAAAGISAAAGVLWSPVSVLASALVVFALILGEPKRWRAPFAAAAGGLALIGLVRFIIGVAVPNIVGSGERVVEEKAVSRLRELLWAEAQTHARTLRYATLPELVASRETPLPGAPFGDDENGVMRSEGYSFVIHPRPDGFVAYAWSNQLHTRRAFAIDERDRICERKQPLDHPPPAPDAAFAAHDRCGTGSEGALWQMWSQRLRKVKAR